ncbi:carbohydrate ABC transporter permease [Rathayibacter sp. CAU 1779]
MTANTVVAETPLRRRSARSSRPARRFSFSAIPVNVVLFLAAAYTFLPLLWMLFAGLENASAISAGDVFSFSHFRVAGNFADLFSQDGGIYARWYLNSILYAGVGSLACALVCVAAGYAFDKYHFRGKEKLFGLVLVGVLVPAAATTLPLYLLASKVGLANTYLAVFIPSLVNPFGVYLARVFSASYIPNEVIEAARVDGASELQIFRRIGLRLLSPGFATITLFQFSAIWNGFLLPLVMLTDNRLFPVSLGLYTWNTQATVQNPSLVNVVMIGSLLAIIPLVIAFVSLQRFWKAGLTAGSVK